MKNSIFFLLMIGFNSVAFSANTPSQNHSKSKSAHTPLQPISKSAESAENNASFPSPRRSFLGQRLFWSSRSGDSSAMARFFDPSTVD